ncbi:hypothetical protein [Photobacterium salinisoli]|uniref:hypothetical protein n=1 Tax=Photobacterium salinisoli TaxID=1616783 RepID=UPI000EA3C613|nr:hypothetical protein [Photobacterium salinisoli]
MPDASRNVDTILTAITEGFAQRYPHRKTTRNWQDRSAYNNRDLEPGLLTVIYTGEIPNDVYDTYIKILVIGRVYCGAKATALETEQAELAFLQEWREFCTSSAFGNISILSVNSSQQQEKPDGWFLAECRSGPYDLAAEIDWLPVGPAELPEGIKASQSPDIGASNESRYFDVDENF